MKFELTRELADQIIFGMENQEQKLVLDTRTAKPVPLGAAVTDPDDPQRYCPLPRWHSMDGFNLMERFVADLRNPVWQETLRSILASGRGVFRQFKNALKERKDIERLWFRFKEKEMRKEVLSWYNALRESWGLEETEIVFEETEDLVLSDFFLERWNEPEDGIILEKDRSGFFELFSDISPENAEAVYRNRREGLRPSDKDSMLLRALTPQGDFAGFLWAAPKTGVTGPGTLHILQLYVCPEYRGLGLAGTLLRFFCKEAAEEGYTHISAELSGDSGNLNALFRNEGFLPFSEILEMRLEGGDSRTSGA
jgi:ribosomal protein S18 acetylase RimI-like enzyme